MLAPGSIIVFSAGSDKLNPDQYRVLNNSNNNANIQNNHFSAMAKYFPFLISFVSPHHLPIVINCYPAPIGNFPNTLFTDTYLRWNNFARALLLAEKHQMTAGIVGQSLVVLDLLLRYKKSGYPFPKYLMIGLGGYYCPLNIEKLINQIVGNTSEISCVFYGYGIGELEFNSLMGMRTDKTNPDHIIYHPITENTKPIVRDETLFLLDITQEKEFKTGDRAEMLRDDAFIITLPPERLDPEIKAFLDQWSITDWQRRTGFLTKTQNGFRIQLRLGEKPQELKNNNAELEFYDYAKQFPFSWLDKPLWGVKS